MQRYDIDLLAERLHRERTKQGYTKAELARITGINHKCILNAETGRYNPSLWTLVQICNVLDISIDSLLETQREQYWEVNL